MQVLGSRQRDNGNSVAVCSHCHVVPALAPIRKLLVAAQLSCSSTRCGSTRCSSTRCSSTRYRSDSETANLLANCLDPRLQAFRHQPPSLHVHPGAHLDTSTTASAIARVPPSTETPHSHRANWIAHRPAQPPLWLWAYKAGTLAGRRAELWGGYIC